MIFTFIALAFSAGILIGHTIGYIRAMAYCTKRLDDVMGEK